MTYLQHPENPFHALAQDTARYHLSVQGDRANISI